MSYFVVSFLLFNVYFNNFLDFDEITNRMEELYYDSFKTFLGFKSELAQLQTDLNYTIDLPEAKDIQIPNFSNFSKTLNGLIQNKMYSDQNKNSLNQLYNGEALFMK
jgi:hypothetical protein